MNAEFNWWLLIVGLVVGAGLVWLVIADWSRREEDVALDERSAESAWIAQAMQERGETIDPAAAEEVLALHRAYLRQMSGIATEPTDAGADDELIADDEGDAATATDTELAPDLTSPTADMADAAGVARPSADFARPAADVATPAPEVARQHADRPSVRTSPLSPRGSPGNPEPEPPV